MQLANKNSDNFKCPCRKILYRFSLAHCGESDTILDANGEWVHCGESDTILDVNGDSAKIMPIVPLTLFRPPITSNLFTF